MGLTRRSLLAVPAAAAFAPAAALAREDPFGAARAVVDRWRTEAPFPAVSAAVWKDGGLRWREAVGLADLERRTPAAPEARFRLASVSKPVAAATAMRLAERGVVDLDAPIGRTLRLPAAHRETTLRQLLAHQGGVRHYIPRDSDPAAPGGPIDRRAYRTTDEKLAIFIDDPLVAPPGETFHYSTFGYTLMSAVLEAAVGRPFPRIVEAEVSGPLALAGLAPDVRGVAVPDRVRDYQPAVPGPAAAAACAPCPPINPAYKWAGGGLIGAAPDIARFGAAFSRPGFLAGPTLAQMTTPTPPRDGRPTTMALGWSADRDPAGRRRLFHAGSSLGARSILVVLPDDGLAVSLLANLGQVPVDPLFPAQRIADAFLA
ncbi:MAG: serine hydrolase domain-containing protein [Pseudomonadota bacterium]